ncbi:MAG: prolyl oligopeptidase family serine peptidase [Kiritimatiellae bacterium]|nr:prolyl oligopeptidase family serine peptidase [Kiritimatiellia bacterium]
MAALLAASAVSAAPDWRTQATARARLHAARLALLAGKYRDIPNNYAVRRWEEAQLDRALRDLAAPAAPSNAPGSHLEAYLDDLDGSAQPFWVRIPEKPAEKPGLLVFLHGYSGTIDRLTIPDVPEPLALWAAQAGAYAVAPFGRGDTDYQHVGERDVLRVIDEMAARYAIDRDKIVLSGHSMGGLGCWCIGARHASLFNAVAIVSGRGDFYEWHGLAPEELPSWQREIVDVQFSTRYLSNLTNTSVVAVHGALDEVVTYNQGRFPVRRLNALGARDVRLVTFPEGGHDVFADAVADASFSNLVVRGLTERLPRAPAGGPAPSFPGEAGSRAMDALLHPFLLVAGSDLFGEGYPDESFASRIREWEDFAHGAPRAKREPSLTMRDVTPCNLVFFGEPEYSRLIAFLLRRAGVAVRPDAFVYAGKRLPRDERHGFLITLANPFNTNRTAIVQCGIPWATGQAHNHRFDRIPDVICYTDEEDRFGYPIAVEAGFIEADGRVRWSPNPTAERGDRQ